MDVYSTSEFRRFEGIFGSASQLPEEYLRRANVKPFVGPVEDDLVPVEASKLMPEPLDDDKTVAADAARTVFCTKARRFMMFSPEC